MTSKTRRLLPNTFIVGAPKCGTTSMAAYLNAHENVFVSNPKEPHFFNDDMGFRDTHSLDDYKAIFADVGDKHSVVVDASALYLYSKNAIPNILAYNPSARFIVMFRHSVDMAYSMHNNLLSQGQESEKNFEKAWRLMEPRSKGKKIPFGNRDPSLLQYAELCKTGAQIQSLLKHVDRKNVIFVSFEEFVRETEDNYRRVLRFLGLDESQMPDFTVHNPSAVVRSRYLRLTAKYLRSLKSRVPINFDLGLLGAIHKLNRVEKKRPPLDIEFRQELTDFFQDDTDLRSKLIGDH
jgi:hypothetical protein